MHDLQEADLPETQRGLVISEIAQFRERAAKRERERVREVKESIPSVVGIMSLGQSGSSAASAGPPSGPKLREWGKPHHHQKGGAQDGRGGFGPGTQGYNKPVGFVKAEDSGSAAGALDDKPKPIKSDEQLEEERWVARRNDEEASFRDVSFRIPSMW